MKNIVFLNTTKFWGGGEKLHLEYAMSFLSDGYNVTILCRKNNPLWEEAASKGIDVHPMELSIFSLLNPFKFYKLFTFFKRKKIDTLVMSTSRDVKLGSVVSKWAKVKRRVYLRGLAVEIRNSTLNRIIFSKFLTHIVANSEETKKKITTNFDSEITRKVSIVYHGIEVDAFNEVKDVENDQFLIGNAGRLTKQKGQNYLLDLAIELRNRNRDFKIMIAGEGELRNELLNRINDEDLGNSVQLLGFVQEMVPFMQNLDVFVLTSIWEGFGYVIAEAMACKKPVVAFNVSSNPELIVHGKTGFLVDFPDIKKMADKIEFLMDNREERIKVGIAANDRVREKFALDSSYRNFVNAISK